MEENSILQKITDLIKNNNITPNKMLVSCNLQSNAYTKWKNGDSKPSLDAIIKIADYFNVSIDYLVGRETQNKNIQHTVTTEIDNDIEQFMQYWEQMDEFQKTSVMGYAQGIINKNSTIQKQNKLA